MGQEQSARASCGPPAPARRHPSLASSAATHTTSPHDPRAWRVASRHSSADFELKSDNSSTESSGYRSGSSGAYEYRSAHASSTAAGAGASDYCHLSLYKNDHYRDINRELYRPVKITKDRRHRLEDASRCPYDDVCIATYLRDSATLRSAAASDAKKSGIRNYTPKILSDEEQKKIENWI